MYIINNDTRQFFSTCCITIFNFFNILFYFLKDYLFTYLFLERGREGERERIITVWLPLMCPLLGTWSVTQACALTGNLTGDSLVHRLALNPLSHTSQGQFFRTQIWFPYGRWQKIRVRDIILKANTIMETWGCIFEEYQKAQVIDFVVIIVIILVDFMQQGITYKVLSHVVV